MENKEISYTGKKKKSQILVMKFLQQSCPFDVHIFILKLIFKYYIWKNA